MWQMRRDLLRALSVMFWAISLGTCFTIVLFSWPVRWDGTGVAATEAPAVVRGSAIVGAEIVPAALQTGSIQAASATAKR